MRPSLRMRRWMGWLAAVITAGPGALAFGAVVILTMIASMQFDPRLIWDPIPDEAPAHDDS